MKEISSTELSNMGLRPLYLEKLTKSSDFYSEVKESLTISDFVFSYNQKSPTINIESLTVPKNSIIAIVGSNGAGKSTFARCVCGLEKKCKGKISINGKKYIGKKCLKLCYMVMQDVNHQLFTESVLNEVLLSMEEREDIKDYDSSIKEAEKILSNLDLLSMKESHPMSLSGGQKQRVAIASAIASEKEIIIFDEPTSGLDLRHMKEVSDNIKQLQKMGKTIFIISHDLELILESCTHVLHLEKGNVIENYSLNEEGQKKVRDFFVKGIYN